MTHSVDQSLFVEGFASEQLEQIGGDFFVICPVADVFLNIVKHFNDLDIRAAVLRTLQ